MHYYATICTKQNLENAHVNEIRKQQQRVTKNDLPKLHLPPR